MDKYIILIALFIGLVWLDGCERENYTGVLPPESTITVGAHTTSGTIFQKPPSAEWPEDMPSYQQSASYWEAAKAQQDRDDKGRRIKRLKEALLKQAEMLKECDRYMKITVGHPSIFLKVMVTRKDGDVNIFYGRTKQRNDIPWSTISYPEESEGFDDQYWIDKADRQLNEEICGPDYASHKWYDN